MIAVIARHRRDRKSRETPLPRQMIAVITRDRESKPFVPFVVKRKLDRARALPMWRKLRDNNGFRPQRADYRALTGTFVPTGKELSLQC